jgi:hypothetical protein
MVDLASDTKKASGIILHNLDDPDPNPAPAPPESLNYFQDFRRYQREKPESR